MDTLKATLAYRASNILGEGPVWHAERKSFFWVDIEGKKLQEIKWPSGEVRHFDLPHRIGLVVPYGENELIIALQGGLARFDIDSNHLEWITDLEKDIEYNRPNDGKCDSHGRLWMGTMDVTAKDNAGSFYSIDKSKNIRKHLDSLTIPNGLAWTSDDTRLYFIDSPLNRVDSYLFNAEEGKIIFEGTVIEIPEELGMPDGMTIDEEGMLWIAQWGGYMVGRWNPCTGELISKIEVPASQVSSCVFGGENLDVLLITTASVGLSDEEREKFPESGHVFFVQTEVKGLLPNKFKGPL